MKARRLLLHGVFLLTLVRVCQGDEADGITTPIDANAPPVVKVALYGSDPLDIRRGIEEALGIELSATVQSKHIWHGLDLLDDHGVFFPVATLTLNGTGFSGSVIGAYPMSSGLQRSEELNYGVFYTGTVLKDTRYSTDFTVNYFYYGKPNVPGRMSDAQEIGVRSSWPGLFGESGLLPSYYVGRLWPSRSDSPLSGIAGFIHVFGLAYDLTLADFWPGGQEQTFRISGEMTYNDGFAGGRHDWSHAVVGLSTHVGKGPITITPYVNFQISMDDSVNSEEEIWCGINLKYTH